VINTEVDQPSAKLSFTFAKFKMAASATSAKELNDLKQCCDPMIVKFQEKTETCGGLDKKKDPSV
jgi:hypothetical protein